MKLIVFSFNLIKISISKHFFYVDDLNFLKEVKNKVAAEILYTNFPSSIGPLKWLLGRLHSVRFGGFLSKNYFHAKKQ